MRIFAEFFAKLQLYYLEHNTEYPMDFYFLFRDELGFDYNSVKYGYAQERIVLGKLIDYYSIKRTPEAARILTFCVSHSLKYCFSSYEENRNDSVTLIRFGLANCAEIFEIRALCFDALATLFRDEIYRKSVFDVLVKYSDDFQKESDTAILEQDIQSFAKYFSELLDVTKFEHCDILRHFHTTCKRHNVQIPDFLSEYIKNPVFMLYIAIKNDWETWNIEEHERLKKIDEQCQSSTDDQFAALWFVLETYTIDSRNSWDLETGIDLIFKSLSRSPQRFWNVLNSYICYGTPFDTLCYTTIIRTMLSFVSYVDVINFIESKEFANKRKWLAFTHANIPERDIDERTLEFFKSMVIAQKDESRIYTLSLATVLRIDALQHGFAVEYISLMNDICTEQPWVISLFMAGIDIRDKQQISAFVNLFESRMDVLETAYIEALRGRHYFDYNGDLMLCIIRNDSEFLSTIVNYLLSSDIYHNDSHLDILWEQDDFISLITFVMEEIMKCQENYLLNRLGEHLLAYEQGNEEKSIRQNEWIKNYIVENSSDMDKMQFIFNIICNLPYEQKMEPILVFCRFNPSFAAFRKIRLLPSHMSWSGSEVPILENQIAFLDKLRDSLYGMAYIEHRAFLAEYIGYKRERIDEILIREFLKGEVN